MASKPLFASVILVIITISCKPSQKEMADADTSITDTTIVENQLNWPALAKKLTDNMSLTSGERVLLVGQPGLFDDMIPELAREIESRQGVYLGTLSVTENQPKVWSTDFVKQAFGADSLQLVDLLKTVDLGVMMPGPVPSDLPYGILQDILEEGSRRTIHFHWSGAYDINGQALQIDHKIDKFYEEVVLTTDYDQLALRQKEFEEAMRTQSIRVTTPAGTDISFQIGDRPVTRQDGNASAKRASAGLNLIDREIEIPSGAIRVAPVEETVNGSVAFPDAVWGGQQVKDLIINFEKGKITSYTAASGVEGVESELSNAPGTSGESFREFALGFNPKLSIPSDGNPWIPYYGYGAGVVRLSLGDNSELGGNVTGGYVRWNFFVDATVVVGDDVWVKDGKLIK